MRLAQTTIISLKLEIIASIGIPKRATDYRSSNVKKRKHVKDLELYRWNVEQCCGEDARKVFEATVLEHIEAMIYGPIPRQ